MDDSTDLERPDRNPLIIAIRRFVDHMDAVRELATVAAESIIHLDDRKSAMVHLLGESLPQSTLTQRRAAIETWENAFGEIRSIKNEDDGRPSVAEFEAIIETAGREIDNLLDNPRGLSHLITVWGRTVGRPRRGPLLRAALLTTAVSGFEVLVSSTIRGFLTLRPAALRAFDAKYTLVDIEGFATIDEFRSSCIDRYTDSLMFGGFDDWIEWFAKRKIDCSDLIEKLDSMREIFQRRHVIIHNGSVVNRQYLLKLPNLDNPPELGTRVGVGKVYLNNALDTLTRFGILLGVRTARKLCGTKQEDNQRVDGLISDLAYTFLRAGHYQMVIDIITSELCNCTDAYRYQIMQVNRWIALKEMNGIDSIRKEVEDWQTDVLTRKFALAQDALLERNKEAYKLGIELMKSGDIATEDWFTWPLLKGVREYEAQLATEKNESAE